MDKLNFSVDYYKVLKENEFVMILEALVVSEGLSLHNTTFDIDTIKEAYPSAALAPVVCLWDDYSSDFKEHARKPEDMEKQRIVGCVPESNRGEIVTIDGVKWQKIDVIIWKPYAPEAAIRLAKNKTTKLSVEIVILEKEKKSESEPMAIKKFRYGAICLLGQKYQEAIPGASMTIAKFSKPEIMQKLYFSMVNEEVISLTDEAISEIKELFVKNCNNPLFKTPAFTELLKFANEKQIPAESDAFSALLSQNLESIKLMFSTSNTGKEIQLDEAKNMSMEVTNLDKVLNALKEKLACHGVDAYGLPVAMVHAIMKEFAVVKQGDKMSKYKYSTDEKGDIKFAEEPEEMDEDEKKQFSLEGYAALEEMVKKMSAEKAQIEGKFAEATVKYAEEKGKLEEENKAFKLKEEIKAKKEKEDKAKEMMSKYAQFLTDEEKAQLTPLSENTDVFNSRLFAIVVPKLEKFAETKDPNGIHFSSFVNKDSENHLDEEENPYLAKLNKI